MNVSVFDAQTVQKVSRVRVKDVDTESEGVVIRVGEASIELPELLADHARPAFVGVFPT